MSKKVEIDRDELKRLQADSAELAGLREPVDLVTVGYLHLDATIGGGWRVSGYPLSERKIYEGALQQPLVRLSDAQRAIAQAGQLPEGFVLVPVNRLKHVHRDLDACQRVIWLAGGFDPAYCTDAQARLKEIEAWIAPQGDSHE